MKKINFKQPKYILPMIALLPLTFLIYNIASIFSGSDKEQTRVVRDSINTALPEADEQSMDDKLATMDKADWSGDSYTGVDRLGEEEKENEEVSQGYTESELDQIDKRNADAIRAAREKAEMERSLAESRKHINRYANASSGSSSFRRGGNSSRSQIDELEDYASALDEIQQRNSRRATASYGRAAASYGRMYEGDESTNERETSSKERTGSTEKPTPPPALVYKTPEKDVEKFHTISTVTSAESSLIKAIIDKTTKARTGTRLRFKLLDGVTIKGVHLPKGAYLYGVVSGFENQRVKANITSILIKDKFVKVNLSVYDNDGMEGFYVPLSVFRNFVKEAGSQAIQNNVNFNSNNSGMAISAEAMALQALQNVYGSATSAISSNLKEEQARIKYNTIVYLINASESND